MMLCKVCGIEFDESKNGLSNAHEGVCEMCEDYYDYACCSECDELMLPKAMYMAMRKRECVPPMEYYCGSCVGYLDNDDYDIDKYERREGE